MTHDALTAVTCLDNEGDEVVWVFETICICSSLVTYCNERVFQMNRVQSNSLSRHDEEGSWTAKCLHKVYLSVGASVPYTFALLHRWFAQNIAIDGQLSQHQLRFVVDETLQACRDCLDLCICERLYSLSTWFVWYSLSSILNFGIWTKYRLRWSVVTAPAPFYCWRNYVSL